MSLPDTFRMLLVFMFGFTFIVNFAHIFAIFPTLDYYKSATLSLTDDADTANHHSALGPGSGPGSLLWLARTCVEEALEEACTPGTRDNIAVEVCR